MANYGIMAMTQQGLALFSKAQSGVALNFTRMQIGSGQLAVGQDPSTLTALITPISYVTINSITSTGNTAYVKGVLDNSGINASTYSCELGLFAQDPDAGEILYAYANAGDEGDNLPPISSGPFSRLFQINVAVGNATDVTATIPENTYIPYAEKGTNGGVATLDDTGKLPNGQLAILDANGKILTTVIPALSPSVITQDSNNRFVTDAEIASWNGKLDDTANLPASQVTQDSTHRFATDTEKNTWNGKVDATTYNSQVNQDVRTTASPSFDHITVNDITVNGGGIMKPRTAKTSKLTLTSITNGTIYNLANTSGVAGKIKRILAYNTVGTSFNTWAKITIDGTQYGGSISGEVLNGVQTTNEAVIKIDTAGNGAYVGWMQNADVGKVEKLDLPFKSSFSIDLVAVGTQTQTVDFLVEWESE